MGPPITPKFGRKCDRGGKKNGPNFFGGDFCQKADKTFRQNIPNLKNRLKKSFFFSGLQEQEVRICVQPNFPIIILILLNGFRKFVISMGPNTSVVQSLWIPDNDKRGRHRLCSPSDGGPGPPCQLCILLFLVSNIIELAVECIVKT